MPPANDTKDSTSTSVAKVSLFAKLFNIAASSDEKKPETAQEKPALG
jgi:hypothetical protein